MLSPDIDVTSDIIIMSSFDTGRWMSYFSGWIAGTSFSLDWFRFCRREIGVDILMLMSYSVSVQDWFRCGW